MTEIVHVLPGDRDCSDALGKGEGLGGEGSRRQGERRGDNGREKQTAFEVHRGG